MKLAAGMLFLLLPAIAAAECDKLSIVDAKALSQEQLKGRICRDMDRRNFYVDSANSFLTHTETVFEFRGVKFTNSGQFYGAWLAELKQANACHNAYRSNAETYADLYPGASLGCAEPHAAETLQLSR